MCAKQRVALYGGTFDPVHQGHLEVAQKVAQLFEIEKVLFVPAQIAPHKLGKNVSSPLHRYAMLALATQGDARLFVSTFELDAPDRRYTVDTVAHFQKRLGESTELFFIMGADSWSEITTWREWERLLTMTNHIIVSRPGYEIGAARPEVRDRVLDLRANVESMVESTRQNDGTKIFFTDVVMRDLSATYIRNVVSTGRLVELDRLVPEPVAEYLKKYRIYQNSNEAKLNS
jgi:nicotinate-nucleotide adenylyltransferase